MARPRTPTNVLELRGSFKAQPSRRRIAEPISQYPIGECPSRLDEGERAAWNEIVSTCCPGVLTHSDRLAVEITARLLSESWEAGREFDDVRRRQLYTLLGQFGMNPSDRSKIRVEPPKMANKFEALSG